MYVIPSPPCASCRQAAVDSYKLFMDPTCAGSSERLRLCRVQLGRQCPPPTCTPHPTRTPPSTPPACAPPPHPLAPHHMPPSTPPACPPPPNPHARPPPPHLHAPPARSPPPPPHAPHCVDYIVNITYRPRYSLTHAGVLFFWHSPQTAAVSDLKLKLTKIQSILASINSYT